MADLLDVFLSHSHKDAELAKGLAHQLREWGITVYAHFDDVALPGLPDLALADRLIENLRTCRLLIFAFSERAASSRWMPWELRLAHGVIGRVMLWPFTRRALRLKSTQEYLHLYEALDPVTAKTRLSEVLDQARNAPYRPADLKMMSDLARITAGKLPDFVNPKVAVDFSTVGPTEIQTVWVREPFKGTKYG